MLSREDILKIATLSKLTLSEEEIIQFQSELSGILEFFNQLEDITTDGVEPTAQVTGLYNGERSDTIHSKHIDTLLSSRRPIVDKHISVPAVL